MEEWKGFCPVCDAPVCFRAYQDWYRDFLICQGCGSVPRHRALMLVLDLVRPSWREERVWEVAPAGPASAKLQSQCTAYTGSQFWPDVPAGTYVNGVRCENVEQTTLEEGSQDIVVSSDVFEHVMDGAKGLIEIARVLAPGGLHVWTVPRQLDLAESRPRVTWREDGSLDYPLPREYHMDPVNDDGALVTYDWGRDLASRVEEATGMQTAVFQLESRHHGILGEFREVFVSHRGMNNPGGTLHMSTRGLQDALAASEARVSELLGSTSWRVTRPLRTLSTALRRRG